MKKLLLNRLKKKRKEIRLAIIRSFSVSAVVLFPLATLAQAPAIQWNKTIGGSSIDYGYKVIQAADGGVVICGSSESGISGDKTEASKGGQDYWIAKLDNTGTKLWDKTIGGNSEDILGGLVQTTDGGYIVAGSSVSGISGDKTEAHMGFYPDFWVVKLDANGNKIWDKTLGGDADDMLFSAVATPDGGCIIGGYSKSGITATKAEANKGNSDFWVIKLDNNGNKQWDRTIGGSGEDNLAAIVPAADGGYLLGGTSLSGISGDKTEAGKGNKDFWLVKLDNSGVKVWDKTIGGGSTDQLLSAAQTSDGGFIMGGWSYSGISGDKTEASRGDNDFWVVKINSNGTIIWDRTIGGASSDRLFGIARAQDGSFLIGGDSDSGISGDKTAASNGSTDYWVVKLSANGTKLWDKTIGGSGPEYFSDLVQANDGGYLIMGSSSSGISADKTEANKGGADYWIVKLEADGTVGIEEHLLALQQVTIYPVPFQSEFRIRVQEPAEGKMIATITDMMGRQVFSQTIDAVSEVVTLQPGAAMPDGIYLLQISYNGVVSQHRIIKQ